MSWRSDTPTSVLNYRRRQAVKSRTTKRPLSWAAHWHGEVCDCERRLTCKPVGVRNSRHWRDRPRCCKSGTASLLTNLTLWVKQIQLVSVKWTTHTNSDFKKETAKITFRTRYQDNLRFADKLPMASDSGGCSIPPRPPLPTPLVYYLKQQLACYKQVYHFSVVATSIS